MQCVENELWDYLIALVSIQESLLKVKLIIERKKGVTEYYLLSMISSASTKNAFTMRASLTRRMLSRTGLQYPHQHHSALSHVVGDTSIPLINACLGNLFEHQAQVHSSGLMLVSSHQNARFTWTEFLDVTDRIASGLLNAGFSPGDRFGICELHATLIYFKMTEVFLHLRISNKILKESKALNE
jgi:hypothetical protein